MRSDQFVFVLGVTAAVVAIVAIVAGIVRTRGRTKEIVVDQTRLFALQREWRAPEELLSTTPRDVRYTKSARVMFVLVAAGILGFATAGVLLIPGMQREQQDNELVRREGVASNGTITARRVNKGKSPSYRVTYAYEVGSRRYTSVAKVARRDYDRFEIGSPAAIHYLPSQPDVSRMDDGERDPPELRLLIFLPIFFLLLVPLIAMRLKKLLAWGTAVGAIVTRVSPTKGGLEIRYQFLGPNGELVEGSDVVPSRGEVKVGEIITVLFDPERPRRKARYPLAMVRVGE